VPHITFPITSSPLVHSTIPSLRRRRLVIRGRLRELLLSVVVLVFDVESVNVSREVAENRERDVDEEIRAAALDEEDADGRDYDVLAGALL